MKRAALPVLTVALLCLVLPAAAWPAVGVKPAVARFAAKGGPGSVTVSVAGATGPEAGLDVSVESGADWVTIVAGSDPLTVRLNARGAGKAKLQFYVMAYDRSTPSPRRATVSVGDASFVVEQVGLPCAVSLSGVARAPLPPEGGTGSFAVAAPLGCAWTAKVTAAWLDLTQGSSDDGATVSYEAAANPGSKRRTATITVQTTGPKPKKKTARVTQAAPPPDRVRPTVTARSPAPDAAGVGPATVVSATFSESMAAATLTVKTFTLTGPAGRVAGAVSYDADTRTATFAPAAPLARGARYTARLTAGAKDLAGNPVAAAEAWSFAVAAGPSLSGTVSGSVRSGVTVALSGASSAVTTTDADGDYSFAGLADGAYEVTPSKVDAAFFPVTTSVTVAGVDAVAGAFTSMALALYDDFSAGTLDASRWNSGQYEVVLRGRAAVLSEALDNLPALASYNTTLSAVPPAGSAVTTLGATVRLTAATASQDSAVRAGIDLWFQPEEKRLSGSLVDSLFARVVLTNTSSGWVAQRSLFVCTNAACSTTQGVGVPAAGSSWGSAGLPVSLGTDYVVSISLDPVGEVITFSLSGGAYGAAQTHSADVSGVTPSFGAANFYRARLIAGVRGGKSAGEDAAVEGRFDDVWIGLDGGTAALFDDFNAGTAFDPARWAVREASVLLEPAPLARVTLSVAEQDGSALLRTTAPDLPALQADVRVEEWQRSGPGRIAARLGRALYNDGSAGTGVPPDVNGPGSQVGDVIATVSMTDTEVSYGLGRCERAVCTGLDSTTVLVEPTLLGTVSRGSEHTLFLQWDGVSRKVVFRLDDKPGVVLDPVAAGAPYDHEPSYPLADVGVRAGPESNTSQFGPGSSGSATATFANVKAREPSP